MVAASAHGEICKPRHFRPPFVIKTMGPCKFDPAVMSFAGSPAEQARCLMRGMDRTRNLSPVLPTLPPGLANRVGSTAGLPTRAALARYLASRGDLQGQFGVYLPAPLSSAGDDDPDMPQARYFVIHDTSGPRYGHRAFPDDINTVSHINNLKTFACDDGWGKAHVVISRTGAMLLNHDFQIPWRETKFELAANFLGALKGLFVHIEMIQPRRSTGAGYNDARSPDPAFTVAQYDALALLYTIASVRRGQWLVPAFHAAIDGDIPNGHDDPLNFDIASFSESVDRVVEMLDRPAELQAASEAAAQNPPAELLAGAPDAPNSTAPVSTVPAVTVALTAAAPFEPKPPELNTGDIKATNAESCHHAHLARSHHLERCRIGADARDERAPARKAHLRRRLSRHAGSARRHRGDLHARHDRGAARHHRA